MSNEEFKNRVKQLLDTIQKEAESIKDEEERKRILEVIENLRF